MTQKSRTLPPSPFETPSPLPSYGNSHGPRAALSPVYALDCCIRRCALVSIPCLKDFSSLGYDMQHASCCYARLIAETRHRSHPLFPETPSPMEFAAAAGCRDKGSALDRSYDVADAEGQVEYWGEVLCDVWHVLEATRQCRGSGRQSARGRQAGRTDAVLQEHVDDLDEVSEEQGEPPYALASCEMLSSLFHILHSATHSLSDLAAQQQRREEGGAGEDMSQEPGERKRGSGQVKTNRLGAQGFIQRSQAVSRQIWEAALYGKDVLRYKRSIAGHGRRGALGKGVRGDQPLAHGRQRTSWRKRVGVGGGHQSRCIDAVASSMPALPASPSATLHRYSRALQSRSDMTSAPSSNFTAETTPRVAAAAAVRTSKDDRRIFSAGNELVSNVTSASCPSEPRASEAAITIMPISHPDPPPTALPTVNRPMLHSPSPAVAHMRPVYAADAATAMGTPPLKHGATLLASPLTHPPPRIPGYRAAVYLPGPASTIEATPPTNSSFSSIATASRPAEYAAPAASRLPQLATAAAALMTPWPPWPHMATTAPRPDDSTTRHHGHEPQVAGALQDVNAMESVGGGHRHAHSLSSSFRERACQCGGKTLHFRCSAPVLLLFQRTGSVEGEIQSPSVPFTP